VDAERPRCYLASPLGFTGDGVRLLHEVYLPALRRVVVPVNPWDLTGSKEISDAEAAGTLRELRWEMGRRNAEAIATSPLLVAYLEGQELDSGTVAEIGYACGLGKRCFGIRSDLRQTGEAEARVNLQVEYFITESRGQIVDTLDRLLAVVEEAVVALRSL
jgi:nucleoside 2-deoxyribosyltransferase